MFSLLNAPIYPSQLHHQPFSPHQAPYKPSVDHCRQASQLLLLTHQRNLNYGFTVTIYRSQNHDNSIGPA
jgi:hypothetical protein